MHPCPPPPLCRHAARSEALLSLDTASALSHKLQLDADDGCYCLSIQSAVPIYNVALAASCELQLQDLPSSVAILSRCGADPANGSATLATYRRACKRRAPAAAAALHAQWATGMWRTSL